MIDHALSNDELRALCRDRKLPVSGNKEELIERLERHEVQRLAIPDDLQEQSEARSLSIAEQARGVHVTNDAEYAAAGEFLTSVIKSALKQLDDAFDPIIQSWHAGHKQTLATKKELAKPLQEAERIVKGAMAEYHRLAQQRQMEEQRRLLRAMQEEAEERAIEEAQRKLEAGDEEGAEEILTAVSKGEVEATSAPPPVVLRAPEAVGVGVRMLKKFRVVDPSKVKRAYLMPDDKAIQGVVNAMGKRAEEVVGGIEYYEEPSVSARAR